MDINLKKIKTILYNNENMFPSLFPSIHYFLDNIFEKKNMERIRI